MWEGLAVDSGESQVMPSTGQSHKWETLASDFLAVRPGAQACQPS
jgi:hypothetical protein